MANKMYCCLIPYKKARNSAIADKLCNAFVQCAMTWLTLETCMPSLTCYHAHFSCSRSWPIVGVTPKIGCSVACRLGMASTADVVNRPLHICVNTLHLVILCQRMWPLVGGTSKIGGTGALRDGAPYSLQTRRLQHGLPR